MISKGLLFNVSVCANNWELTKKDRFICNKRKWTNDVNKCVYLEGLGQNMTRIYQQIYLCTRSNTHIFYTHLVIQLRTAHTTACSAVPRVNANSSYRMSLIMHISVLMTDLYKIPEFTNKESIGTYAGHMLHRTVNFVF